MTGGNTDIDGNYSIDIPSDGVLIFSCIGFQTKEIAVEGRSLVNLELAPDTQVLEETIVVAFGESTKEAFTGSAAVVKSSDISKVQSSSATRALEGVVAGVQMTTSSGSIGSSPSIVMQYT
jgi:outer membrane receptor for Fe3+-dicitrate